MSKNAKPAAKTVMAAHEKIIADRTAALKTEAKEYAGLLYRYCTVSEKARGTNAQHAGKTVKCVSLGVSKWGKPLAFFTLNGTAQHVINPDNLTPGDLMSPDEIVKIDAMQEAERKRTVIVPALVVSEKEKSIGLRMDGYAQVLYVARSLAKMISERPADGESAGYFEVPAWTIRSRFGTETLAAIDAKQGVYTEAAAG